MNPAPASSALATSSLFGSACDDRLRELARILARSLGEPHRDVAREVAVFLVARAFDDDLGRIDRLGQNTGNK